MLIIKLQGGLGNQLFQYAFGRLISLRRNEPLRLDREELGAKSDTYRSYSLDYFNIKAEIAGEEEIRRIKYPYGIISRAWRIFSSKILRRFHIGYEANLLETKASYLSGFFQSYRYLEPIREELLEEISLKDAPSAKFQELSAAIKGGASVSLHIRRGDYVNNEKIRKQHFVCDLKYYEQAIAIIKEKVVNPVFYVFSDDIAWAKENLQIAGAVFVSGPEIADQEEMMLMSLCCHNIIANSSFSFWGAWLNQNQEKIVVAPKVWNRRYGRHFKELLPTEWMRV